VTGLGGEGDRGERGEDKESKIGPKTPTGFQTISAGRGKKGLPWARRQNPKLKGGERTCSEDLTK